MAEADADFLFRGHLHDLFRFRQHFAVLAAQTHALFFRVAGAAPETVGGESRKPNHFEVGILKPDANVLRSHAEAHPHAAVNLDAMGQLASRDHVVDVPLRQIGRRCADVPVVFKGNGAHTALGRLDGDLKHVLRTMDEIRISVDVAVDGAL